MGSPFVRRANSATNPLHSLVYFAPETERRLSGLGLEGGRMCYFAGRAAPMGPVGAEVVTATFYNFNPALVAASIPRAWQIATPEAVIAERLAAADETLRRLLGPDLAARGLLDGDGELTDAGRELRAHVEDETDRMAAPPWRHLGDEGTEEVIRIGQALTRAALAAGAFPSTGVFAPAR